MWGNKGITLLCAYIVSRGNYSSYGNMAGSYRVVGIQLYQIFKITSKKVHPFIVKDKIFYIRCYQEIVYYLIGKYNPKFIIKEGKESIQLQ